MLDSILETVKKLLGIPVEDTAFDADIITAINTALMVLNQIGIGGLTVFSINDNSETWVDFLGNDLSTYAAVKSYMYLKVKLIFDPPPTSFGIQAIENQITEYEYRLKSQAEARCYLISIGIISGIPTLGAPVIG